MTTDYRNVLPLNQTMEEGELKKYSNEESCALLREGIMISMAEKHLNCKYPGVADILCSFLERRKKRIWIRSDENLTLNALRTLWQGKIFCVLLSFTFRHFLIELRYNTIHGVLDRILVCHLACSPSVRYGSRHFLGEERESFWAAA